MSRIPAWRHRLRSAFVRLALAGALGPVAGGARAPADALVRPAPVLARPSALPHLLGASGGLASSALTIQVRDCEAPAMAVADFFRQGGGTSLPIARAGIEGCGANYVYGQPESSLSGGHYAVGVSSDRAIALWETTDWPSTGGHALDDQSEPGTDVVLPWAGKAADGLSSFVSIQNLDTAASVVAEVSVFPVGATVPDAVFERAIGPGTSITLAFGGARDLELVRLPAGLVGHVRVRAASPVAVQAFVDAAAPAMGVAGIEGVPVALARETLYAPRVSNDGVDGGTWIAVVNPGTSATDVAVTYRADGPDCPTTPTIHGGRAHRLAAGAMAVFDQREATGSAASTGPSGLPAGCQAAATIAAAPGGTLVATVMAAGARSGTLAGYTAWGEEAAGRRMLVPMFQNRHSSAFDVSTDLSAMNLGDDPADVALRVRDANGRELAVDCPECRQTIQPRAAFTWRPPTMPSMWPYANSYGSAVVLADQPLAVVVTDASGHGARDAGMVNAIAAIEPAAPPMAGDPGVPLPSSHLPLYLIDASLPGDGARPWVVGRVALPYAVSVWRMR